MLPFQDPSVTVLATSDDIRAKAESLLDAIEAKDETPLSPVAREILTVALSHDIAAASDQTKTTKDRITKIESQTQALAEAVIALAEPIESIITSVKAVRAEMDHESIPVEPVDRIVDLGKRSRSPR